MKTGHFVAREPTPLWSPLEGGTVNQHDGAGTSIASTNTVGTNSICTTIAATAIAATTGAGSNVAGTIGTGRVVRGLLVGLVLSWVAGGPTIPAAQAQANPYAATVIEYVPGQGIPLDWLSGEPFSDPTRALGRPTIDTTGDNWNIPLEETVPVVPVHPAFRSSELVSVGPGGHLILEFAQPVVDDSRNPYGVDFIVFGNSAWAIAGGAEWLNGDPQLVHVAGGGFSEPARVSVSQDGVTWHEFTDSPYPGDGPRADVFAPTLGRNYDPLDPDPSLGAWNLWWSGPTDPTCPLNPAWRWADFTGWSVADVAAAYAPSAGGTGFDLVWLGVPGLDWIRYLRVDGPTAGSAAEVDAVADVFAALGDCDRDADVDLADYAAFQVCYTGDGGGPRRPDCICSDFDGDGAVGLGDLAGFVEALTGPFVGGRLHWRSTLDN